MTAKLYAFHHVVWARVNADLVQFLAKMSEPWYRSRFYTHTHYINGHMHVFIIRKRGCNSEFSEIGVHSLREQSNAEV